MEVTNRYITIKNHIDGAPKESDFELKAAALPLKVEPGTKVVIVKNLYVSIDPYQVNRMKSIISSQSATNAAVGVNPGEGIDAHGVGKVVASGNTEFEKGDLVVGIISWGDYTVVKPGVLLRKFDPLGLPLSYQVGILGFSGLTAYAGLFDICKPKKGEKVFVSAASGSVGNLVGQYAKLFGCYVVGSAGNNEKVALLKEKLGFESFDDAFNYKEETDLKATLKRGNREIKMASSSGKTKRNHNLLRLVEERALSKKTEKEHKKQQVPYLSKDCVWNILIRLPIQSLSSMRFVCKPWCSIISDGNFIDAYLHCSETVLISLRSHPLKTTPPDQKMNTQKFLFHNGMEILKMENVNYEDFLIKPKDSWIKKSFKHDSIDFMDPNIRYGLDWLLIFISFKSKI